MQKLIEQLKEEVKSLRKQLNMASLDPNNLKNTEELA